MSKQILTAWLMVMGLLLPGIAAGEQDARLVHDTGAVYEVAVRGGDIWAGWTDAVYYSSDYGMSWRRYDTSTGFGPGWVSAIFVAEDTVWAATYYAVVNAGVEYYVNGGIYSGGLNNPVWEYHEPPYPTDPGNIIYDITISEGVVWTANWWKSLQRSDDGGATWHLIIPDTVPYLNPRDRLNQRIFSVAVDQDIIWAGSQDGLNLSRNGGQSWTTIRRTGNEHGLIADKVAALAFRDSGDVRQLWAACWTTFKPGEVSGLSISSDTGLTWRYALPGQRVWNILFNQGDAFAATDSGLMFSSDGGNFFTNLSTGSLQAGTPVYAVGMTDDFRLMVGTGSGLYYATYDGDYWEKVDFIQLPAEDHPAPIPGVLAIDPGYPNPFNPSTTIPIYLPQTGVVKLEIYDILGRRQRTLVSTTLRAGGHEYVWDGRDDAGRTLASGVYFCRLTDGRAVATRRLILLR